jgi:hypothetical protein
MSSTSGSAIRLLRSRLKILDHPNVDAHQIKKIAKVTGMEIAQKTQNDWETTGEASQFNSGRDSNVAIAVPGRKSIVMNAITFIEKPSALVARTNSIVASVSPRVMRVTICPVG